MFLAAHFIEWLHPQGVGIASVHLGGFWLTSVLCFSTPKNWSLAEFRMLSAVEVTPLVLQLVILLIYIYHQAST